ncbi:Glutathione S-transferase 4 [Diplonema papillatum]|nr:Glutathione S-transferase 4 [Diplonema papillatum]
MTTPKIKLTYFDFESIAEPIRLALVMNKVPFEDERIKVNAWSEWLSIKPTTKFGQLPIMKIDNVTFAQSGAMLRYVGKSFGEGALYPQNGPEYLKVEEAMGLVEDMAKDWDPCFSITLYPDKYGHDAEFLKTDVGKAKIAEMREGWVKDSLPKFAKFFSQMIDENGGFLCGKKPTIADCLLLPHLRKFQKGMYEPVPVTCLDQYTTLTAWIKRMMEIPEIAEWYKDRR